MQDITHFPFLLSLLLPYHYFNISVIILYKKKMNFKLQLVYIYRFQINTRYHYRFFSLFVRNYEQSKFAIV